MNSASLLSGSEDNSDSENNSDSYSQNKKKMGVTKYPFIVAIIGIALIGGALRFWNLGAENFKGDEFQVVSAAAGYYHTGTFYRWDWINKDITLNTQDCSQETCYYDRAWPHTFWVAQSFNVFGINEWSARFFSAVFGVLMIPIGYLFAAYFSREKVVGVLFAMSIALLPTFISLSQYTRMYIMLIPLFLISTYGVYKSLNTQNYDKGWRYTLGSEWVSTYLNFDYVALLLTLPVLYITYEVHRNALVILPTVFLFIIFLLISKREYKYFISSVVGGVTIVIFTGLTIFADVGKNISTFLSWLDRSNYVYIKHLFQEPFTVGVGVALALISLALVTVYKKEETRLRFIYLWMFLIFALPFFMFVADRYASGVYISMLIPIALLLSIFGLYALFYRGRNRVFIFCVVMIVVGSISTVQLINSLGDVYKLGPTEGRDFKKAYNTIVKNYSPHHVIFGQYPRGPYLRDLEGDVNLINMKSNNKYKFVTFLQDLQGKKEGWVTYGSNKGYHIRGEIKNFICNHFEHKHGKACEEKVDNIGVEVFYFNREMLPNDLPQQIEELQQKEKI
jgi:hypothetical protein